MSSVKAVTHDLIFTARIASFYPLSEEDRTNLVIGFTEWLSNHGKEKHFLVHRGSMEKRRED